jgi:hypothetical protein
MSDDQSWTKFTISLRDWTSRTCQAESPIFAVWLRHITDSLSTGAGNDMLARPLVMELVYRS